MEIDRIMVQLASYQWTLEATHQACQIARSTKAEIIFVKLVPVQHMAWLGTDLGYRAFSVGDYDKLRQCASTAEDYAVGHSVQAFQYANFVEGIVQAAGRFDAQLVFATSLHPRSLLGRLQGWQIRHALARYRRQLAEADIVSALLSFPDQDFRLPVPAVAEKSDSLGSMSTSRSSTS